MKVLFLDIDGVANSATYAKSLGKGGMLGIDPAAAKIIRKLIYETECFVVISSTWRHSPDLMAQIQEQITQRIYGQTPYLAAIRGAEIKKYLDEHPEITHYAIVDDDSDMLPEQKEHFFKTSWETGITPEIAKAITEYLGYASAND